MKNKALPWEHGSEFHWLGPNAAWRARGTNPWPKACGTVGSGRDALRLLYRYGRAALGWRRALVPSYLCQEVVGAIADEGLAMEAYFDDPREPIHAPSPGRGEAVLVVNTFGLRPRWTGPGSHAGAVIEDHTHDPWSAWARESQADFCVASLRKTLPIPDGAVLWSPAKLPLPDLPKLTLEHEAAAARKLEAMVLKALFLSGKDVDKATFRALAAAGETGISTREISAMNPVSAAVAECFDVVGWREQRHANYRLVAERLADHLGLSVLPPRGQDSCPFSVIIVCPDHSMRERLRRGLIARRVYPAILWPLEERVLDLPGEIVELSRRVLSLHCDGRYGEADMARVARAVVESLS